MDLSRHKQFRRVAKADRSSLLTGNTALVFGCPHARPDESQSDFDRFFALGEMALDFKVGAVVCTGDLADYPAARSWNSVKRQEGKRILADRMAGIEAWKALMSAYNRQKKSHAKARHKERTWEPRWLLPLGNHDVSEDDVVANDPKLEGLIGSQFLIRALEDLGVEVWPFLPQIYRKEYPDLHGTLVGHYYPSGNMGKALAPKSVLNTTHESFIGSHSHTGGLDSQQTARGNWIHHLNVETFQPPNRLKSGERNGVFLLSEMHDGDFQVHRFSYDWVLRTYGRSDYAQQLRAARAHAHQDREDADMAFS